MHTIFYSDIPTAHEPVFLEVGEFVSCYTSGNLVALDYHERSVNQDNCAVAQNARIVEYGSVTRGSQISMGGYFICIWC